MRLSPIRIEQAQAMEPGVWYSAQALAVLWDRSSEGARQAAKELEGQGMAESRYTNRTEWRTVAPCGS